MKDKKSSTGIPLKILKDSSLRLDERSTDLLNNTVHTGVWPNELRSDDITPTLEKKSPETSNKLSSNKCFPFRIKSL